MNTKHIEAAIESAQRNGGVLTRNADGTWRGAPGEKKLFSTEVIATLVKDKRATYTRFKPGKEDSKAGIEVTVT